MTKHNPVNERIKRKYFDFLKEAKGYNESTIDGVAKALNRFEVYTKHLDFKKFHFEKAVAFKRHLADQEGQRTGKLLSKATLHSTFSHLKHFFQWLSQQPGYRSRIQYSDAEYFNLSDKEIRAASTKRPQKVPSMEQIKYVINKMPSDTEIEMRNRALIAFTLLTGARDRAIASIKLKHVDLVSGCVNQDAREVQTKFSKTFTTFFFPVGEEIREVVADWVSYLRDKKLWGNDDPLFPSTLIEVGSSRRFEVTGIKCVHWNTTSPIRNIFREAFLNAGLTYFNPHSFRNTLVQLGHEICRRSEQVKAWSQNIGHERVMTTFMNYGEVTYHRQGEIIRDLAKPQKDITKEANEFVAAVFQRLNKVGMDP
jgi:site-specific recombinase XerD